MSFPPFNPAPLAGDSPDFAGGYAVGGQIAVNTEFSLDGTGAATAFQNVFVGAAAGLCVIVSMAFPGQFRCQLTWGPVSGVTTSNLTDTFFKNGQVTTIFQVPVKAPFISMFMDQGTANLQNVSVQVLAIAPGAFGAPYFQPSVLLNEQGVAVPANTGEQFQPSLMMPGRFHLWVFSTGAPSIFEVQQWTGASWNICAREEPPGSTSANLDFTAPLNDWRINLFNNSGAGETMYAVITGPS